MIFMKNKKLLIRISAILLICIAFLFLIIVDPYKNIEEEKVALLDGEEKIFSKITKQELLKLFNNSTAVVYIGKINNEDSKVIEKVYDSARKSLIDKIYYINIEDEKSILKYENDSVVVIKEETNFFKKLLDKLGSFAETYKLYNQYNEPINSGYKTIYTPMVIFIRNGKVIFTHYIDSLDKTDEELNLLEDIYIEGFKKINY